jgi:hypothetical protein
LSFAFWFCGKFSKTPKMIKNLLSRLQIETNKVSDCGSWCNKSSSLKNFIGVWFWKLSFQESRPSNSKSNEKIRLWFPSTKNRLKSNKVLKEKGLLVSYKFIGDRWA